MKVCVIGAGYVGLVTALGLADIGRHCVCVEQNPHRLDCLRRGEAPFFEPGLDALMARVRASGRFETTADLDAALADAEVALLAVGTPSTDAGIDLTDIRRAAAAIGARLPRLGRYLVIAVKSTVVPGTTDGPVRAEIERASGMPVGEFGLAMVPEFLREGCAVSDFLEPDRIVIGASDARAGAVIERMCAGFDCPIINTNLRNAEMIKYSSNALLASLISFSNEVTRICERVQGLDEETVMRGLHSDRRIWVKGTNGERLVPQLATYLRGGIGYGGSCFPKDVRALECFAASLGVKPHLLQAVRTVNEGRAADIVDLLERNLGTCVDGLRIAVLGLAFKPQTDDTRESAGLRVTRELARRGADVVAHDPLVTSEILVRAGLQPPAMAPSLEAVLDGAQAAIIATGWQEYQQADWPVLTQRMARPLILDGRQTVPPAQRGRGFVYAAAGMHGAIGPL